MGKILLLRLEGALQSWGDHAKWDVRDSGDFPSKSGVVGLLACAMGLERGDPKIADLSAHLHMAVRADHPGVRMLDFQTVQGRPLYNAEGKPRPSNTILSPRWYLQDASFLAALETTDEWLERITAALKRPAWPIYLGRKNCVPSRPALEGVTEAYSDLMDAIKRHPIAWRREDGAEPEMFYYESELPQPGAGSYTRADHRVSGGREFALRQVYRGVITREVAHVSDEN